MAKIKVNHATLEKTAGVIEDKIRTFNQTINQANSAVGNMTSMWTGTDYGEYKTQWEKATGKGSPTKAMTKALQAYADYLKYAAEMYKKAQGEAVNRSKKIPV